MAGMTRRQGVLVLGLSLAACARDPLGNYLGGVGDPVRAAALQAPRTLGDTSQYRGQPAGAARAAAQLEFLTSELETNPRYAPSVSPTLVEQLRVARTEMRQAIGIAPDTNPQLVVTSLRRAAAALDAGSRAGAEAALSGTAFPDGPEATLNRLGNLPRLPRTAAAARQASDEFLTNRRL
jgi:hypothetical protein